MRGIEPRITEYRFWICHQTIGPLSTTLQSPRRVSSVSICYHALRMNKDTIQNIFIGILLGGVILLAGGVYYLAMQVQTATQGIQRIEQGMTEAMQKADDAMMKAEEGAMKVDEAMMKADEAMMKADEAVMMASSTEQAPEPDQMIMPNL